MKKRSSIIKLLMGAAVWIITSIPTLAQVHHVPFASKGNQIQLEVANETTQHSDMMTVIVSEAPGWIQFKQNKQSIATLSAGHILTANFEFDLSSKAPVETTGSIIFDIYSKGKKIKSKEILVSSDTTEDFQLFPNYPNPFNPTTTISYQLPLNMDVSIQIYNVLGQKITELVNTRQNAGLQQIRWDASAQASGLYLYRIIAKSEGGKEFINESKMLLIK